MRTGRLKYCGGLTTLGLLAAAGGCLPEGQRIPLDASLLSGLVSLLTGEDASAATGDTGATGQAGAGSGVSILAADYGDPSQHEQYMLELINRARRAPADEAARLGLDSASEGVSGLASGLPAQPLAMSGALLRAARAHTADVFEHDDFDNAASQGGSAGTRIGAQFPTLLAGENIGREPGEAIGANTATIHDALFADIEVAGRPHRQRMLDVGFKQIGVGIAIGRLTFDLLETPATVATIDFATSNRDLGSVFVTGVAFADGNANGAYDPGEGQSGVAVSLGTAQIGTATLRTAAQGGYAFQVFAPGVYVITFRADPTLAINVDVRDKNIKVDLRGSRIEYFDPNQ